METTLKQLKDIEKKMAQIGIDIRREHAIYKAELEDRLSKNLQGDAAIEHYNEWMKRYNLPTIGS